MKYGIFGHPWAIAIHRFSLNQKNVFFDLLIYNFDPKKCQGYALLLLLTKDSMTLAHKIPGKTLILCICIMFTDIQNIKMLKT